VTALGARSEFVTVCIRFDNFVLVKTRSLAVLLFLFFLLLGFNHFIEEGLAEAVNITHALLGKAPKIKFKKGTHFIKCQLSLKTFIFLIF
jgi:hypothetical protein